MRIAIRSDVERPRPDADRSPPGISEWVSAARMENVDTHQRAMWESMLTEVDRFRSGDLSLGTLVDDLRGLYVEADPHEPRIRSDFEAVWSRIDGEHELRTEPWAPPGSASDAHLATYLDEFSAWVRSVLANDDSSEHR
jgi:hypothetical protein